MEKTKLNTKRLTVSLDDYVIEAAKQKADIMFKGNLDNYINWLICNNNKLKIKKKIEEIQKRQEENRPKAIPDTDKTAMFNNTCDYCNQPIYQGDDICKAEGYENYIHKKCCKKEN